MQSRACQAKNTALVVTFFAGCSATLASFLLVGCTWAAEAVVVASVGETPETEFVIDRDERPAEVTGREIYRRLLNNKYRRGVQEFEIVSTDPGGSAQTTVFTASLEDNRDEHDDPVNGINASVLIEVTRPFDMRHTRYLMIAKEPGPDDEFVYQPSTRLVKRVDLKRTPLLGTDYTFDDLAYHDLDGGRYERLADELLDGVSVYVVEAMVTETHTAVVHRSISYIEKEHYIPIKIRYWDEFEVEIKEMTARVDSIKSFGETWIATQSTMRDLAQGTSSHSHLLSLDTNPNFSKMYFSTRRLAQGN
jgi:hypothetical protein